MSKILSLCFVFAAVVSFGMQSARAAENAPAEKSANAGPKSMRVYVGTYTGPKSNGIYLFDLDLATGALKEVGLAVEATNPAFLALSPDNKYLYAVGELGQLPGAGAVSAFSVDQATGKLKLLNQLLSGGGGPCHVSTNGKYVFAANYASGSVASFPIEDDGQLGPPFSMRQHQGKGTNPTRQTGPHAHGIWTSPDNKFALACDLGLDQVLVYKLEPRTGALIPNDPPFARVPDGAGARHAAFSGDGKFLYVINEMGNSMTAFSWDAVAGVLKEIQTLSTLPDDFKGKSSCAEVVVHPSGQFLYGSNRGHDSIAAFKVDPSTGKLAPAGHTPCGGKSPRSFNVDPTGQWLVVAHHKSDSLAVFKIDQTTGGLEQVGRTTPVGSPACVVFVGK